MKQIFTQALVALCLFFSLPAQAQDNEALPLPDHLLSFHSSIENTKATLIWNIDKNEHYNVFAVEKSENGKDFTNAGIIFTSNKAGVETYTFKSAMRPDEIAYYRLKVVNNNKASYYSKTIIVKPQANTACATINLLENPVKANLTLNYNSQTNNICTIAIYNAYGVNVYTSTTAVNKGVNTINFNLANNITRGTYIVDLINNGNHNALSFVKD